MLAHMKKLKRREEISAMQSGITTVRPFNFHQDYLPTKEISWDIPIARARPELQVQRYPEAQLNRHQHGVWV
jgi:hypothetical protein